jgi:hypothetical protein
VTVPKAKAKAKPKAARAATAKPKAPRAAKAARAKPKAPKAPTAKPKAPKAPTAPSVVQLRAFGHYVKTADPDTVRRLKEDGYRTDLLSLGKYGYAHHPESFTLWLEDEAAGETGLLAAHGAAARRKRRTAKPKAPTAAKAKPKAKR